MDTHLGKEIDDERDIISNNVKYVVFVACAPPIVPLCKPEC
jgi:hypothetical protein